MRLENSSARSRNRDEKNGVMIPDSAPNAVASVPQANGEIAVEPLMNLKHVADAIVYMAGLPLEANVQFMTVMATKMPFVGRG